jgi:hypothetical protein
LPALNVEFSGDGQVMVRSAAADAGMSMRSLPRQAILDKAGDRVGRIRAVAQKVTARSAELNRRVG